MIVGELLLIAGLLEVIAATGRRAARLPATLAGLVTMATLDALAARTAPRLGDGAPMLVLGWMTLGGALAHAAFLDLPGSAAWGVVLAVPVLVALARQRTRR